MVTTIRDIEIMPLPKPFSAILNNVGLTVNLSTVNPWELNTLSIFVAHQANAPAPPISIVSVDILDGATVLFSFRTETNDVSPATGINVPVCNLSDLHLMRTSGNLIVKTAQLNGAINNLQISVNGMITDWSV